MDVGCYVENEKKCNCCAPKKSKFHSPVLSEFVVSCHECH